MVANPLETLLSSLIACEVSTLKAQTTKGDFHIKSVKFTRVESGYDTFHFVEGGKDNKINEIIIEAEIQSNGTQEQLDEVEKRVENCCPVYQMITGSGVKITNNWTNIQTA